MTQRWPTLEKFVTTLGVQCLWTALCFIFWPISFIHAHFLTDFFYSASLFLFVSFIHHHSLTHFLYSSHFSYLFHLFILIPLLISFIRLLFFISFLHSSLFVRSFLLFRLIFLSHFLYSSIQIIIWLAELLKKLTNLHTSWLDKKKHSVTNQTQNKQYMYLNDNNIEWSHACSAMIFESRAARMSGNRNIRKLASFEVLT